MQGAEEAPTEWSHEGTCILTRAQSCWTLQGLGPMVQLVKLLPIGPGWKDMAKLFLGVQIRVLVDDWSVCRLAAAASSSQMFAAGDCPLQDLQPAQTTEVPGWGGSRTTALPQPYFILLLSVLSSQGPSCCKPWHPWILHGNINITVITQARFNTVRNSQIFLEEKKMFSRREASLCKLYTNMWMCVRRTSGRLHARHNVRGIKNMEKDAKF